MVQHLLRAGYSVTVFNRTKEKAAFLLEQGATWGETPRDVAAQSKIVFTMVGYPEDVQTVILGEQGVLQGWKESRNSQNSSSKELFSPMQYEAALPNIVVDMTTSSPLLAKEIFFRCQEEGVAALDAPVSGGDLGAKNGSLSIMIGGEKEIADVLLPLWQLLGKNIVWQGAAGSGQNTKMVNQILIAGNMIGVCESLLYATEAGLDLDKVLMAVSAGAAGSWSLSNLAPRILAGDFQPGFFVEHFIKDMGIALDEAQRMKLALPGLALVRQLYIALVAQGGGRLGTQALIQALASLSGK